MNQPANPRTVKTSPPVGTIIGIVLGCLLLLGAIFYATITWNQTFQDARMTGVIIEKQFTPEPSREVTIGQQGITARDRAGEFTFTVRVTNRDGDTSEYRVWVPEAMYNQFNVGDKFDVGPYLVETPNQ